MAKIKLNTISKHLIADTLTPVGIYLKLRDQLPNAVLLESSDYHSNENSYSFIGLQPIATFKVDQGMVYTTYPDGTRYEEALEDKTLVPDKLNAFIDNFDVEPNHQSKKEDLKTHGLFGYCAYDAVQYFENIHFKASTNSSRQIPDVVFSLYKYIIAINHYEDSMTLRENLVNGETENLDYLCSLLNDKSIPSYNFEKNADEASNITDDEYREIVARGKEHCKRGDVFQIVLSRQFSQNFMGDDFNVYRALRSINPSPYLFYFDYGSYHIFGSSPESQIVIQEGKAEISPIAGTFKRTGNDEADEKLASELTKDPKENAEHIMLVDLARNDLSRNSTDVKVENYQEIQFYSHVIHMVSRVTGRLNEGSNAVKVMADSFPAGTLSGAPKYMAMELIDKYEKDNRGYYGGSIGFIGFNGDINQAIMIRSFLSKDNTLYYQAGAGVVNESDEENELNEVNNKLMALKKALDLAEHI